MIPLSGADRCAPSAERRGDQLFATAAPVLRWLLVEQLGGWGRDALLESRIDQGTAAQLARAAAERRLRIVLIRRPGRAVAKVERAWAYVDSRPGHEVIRWGSYVRHTELLDGPIDGTVGTVDSTPTYLVCAHGRHDVCCAINGRPVAARLDRLRPGKVWECSHIGGDRFAANVVVLPEGLYYGHVPSQDADDLVTAHDGGLLLRRLLRGRSSLAAPVQAAQHYARELLDEARIAALAPLSVRAAGHDAWHVVMSHQGGQVAVVVRAEAAPPARLTCSSSRLESVRVFRLVDSQITA